MYNNRSHQNDIISPVKLSASSNLNNPFQATQTTNPESIRKPSQQQMQQNPQQSDQQQKELWKSRCNELESSLYQANTDLELANFRARKACELEQKVENILKQNSAICTENEILQKQVTQKKAESELWKQKYESQMNNIIQLKANYEMENKRLLQENQRLNDELKQGEIDKIRLSEETRFKCVTEFHEKNESLKKQHSQNIELCEEQLRKLRQIVEDREKEISILQSNVSQAKYDGDYAQTRICEDRERLKMKISELEIQAQQELDNLRSKLDNQTAEQLDSLKKLHDNELEVMAGEINKLRNLLDIKTREIEALIDQNRGQKINFDEETNLLRMEIQAFKDRIIDNNEFANAQIQEMKEQLSNQNAQDIQALKYHNENQIEALENQIESLKNIINDKQNEIENQLKEKALQRENYNQELQKLCDEIENWSIRYDLLEKEKNRQNEEAQQKYNQLNQNQNEYANQQQEQIKYQHEEIENLKRLAICKGKEIDSIRDQNNLNIQGLQQDLKNRNEEIANLTKNIQLLQNEKDIQVEELKMKNQILTNSSNEQKKKLETAIKYLELDNQRLKEIIELKEKEVQNLQKQRENLEREIKKLTNQTNSQQNHIQRLEKLKSEELEEQRKRLEKTNNYTIEQIKISHQNQVNIMNGEIEDLKNLCAFKNSEFNELLNKYEKMECALAEYRYNADRLKDYSNQCREIGNEILNNKSIYDSYAKARNSKYPSNNNIK